LDHYQQALDLRPDLSSYSRAAHLLWMTGDVVKARWLMQKAIEAGGPHPENTAWCRAQLALMSFHSGSLISAERELELALREAPRNPHVLAAAGRLKAAGKNYEAAIDHYRESADRAPTHDALAALVDLYKLTGRLDQAQAQFDRVVAFHQTHNSEHAKPHEHGNPGDDASSESSIKEHDVHEHPHGNSQLARFYADQDRHLEVALREAKAAWDAYPNVMAADTLAWCLYKNGKFDEAARMIRRALKHGTPDAAIHFHAGMIYFKLGNRPSAQQHLYQALSLNPQFHPTQVQLAADTIAQLSSQTRRTKEAE
jgi:tetratricopeptide (TPR) repeat protein